MKTAYKIYFFLEDRLIESVLRITVETGINKPARANITLPPSYSGSNILPGMRTYIFLQEEDDKENIYLWFNGEIENTPTNFLGNNNKSVNFWCKSDFGAIGDTVVEQVNILKAASGATNGAHKVITGSGSVRLPTINKQLSVLSMLKTMTSTTKKGKVKGEAKEAASQIDEIAQAKGKIFAFIQSLAARDHLLHAKLRRTRALDHLAIHLEEASLALLQNLNAGQPFATALLQHVFGGNKSIYTALVSYLGTIHHEIVSVCPPRGDVKLDLPKRGEGYLPVKGFDGVYEGSAKNGKFTIEDFMEVQRDVDSYITDMIKPNMEGTFPPICNVLTEDKYEHLDIQRPQLVTRGVMRENIFPGISYSVIRPNPLEQSYWSSIKYGGNKDTQIKSRVSSDIAMHSADDYTTNEEKILGKRTFTQLQGDPNIVKTHLRHLSQNNDELFERKEQELKESEKRFWENNKQLILDTLVLNLEFEDDKDYIRSEIKTFLEKFGFTASIVNTHLSELVSEYFIAKRNNPDQGHGTEGELKSKAQNLLAKAALTKKVTAQDKFNVWLKEADKRFDKQRESSIQVEASFNLEPICGFPMIFVDSSGGDDVVGYLVGKRDTIDINGGTTHTEYELSGGQKLIDIDFNQYTPTGNFKQKVYGLPKYAWGQFSDYSLNLYKKYLNCPAYVPLSVQAASEYNFNKMLLYKTSTSLSPELKAMLETSKLITYSRTFLEEALIYMGAKIKKKDFSRLEAEDRHNQLEKNKLELTGVPNTYTEYYPSLEKLQKYTRETDIEEYYCIADILANIIESMHKDNPKKMMQALDAKAGKLIYMVDVLQTEQDFNKIILDLNTSFKEVLDHEMVILREPLIGQDTSLAHLASDQTTINEVEAENPSKKGDENWVPDETEGWDSTIEWLPSKPQPRWLGNPGVHPTELLLAYLSCYKDNKTIKEIWGDGSIGMPANSERVIKPKSLNTNVPSVEEINTNIDNNPQQVIKYISEKTGKKEQLLKSILDKSKLSLSELMNNASSLADNPFLQKYDRSLLNELKKAFRLIYHRLLIMGHDVENLYENLKKWDASVSSPVPRPLSEKEVIEIRRRIAYSVYKEYSNYAR